MLVLALETIGRQGSVALCTGRRDAPAAPLAPLATIQLPRHPRSAASLLPAIDGLLREHQRRPQDVELIAVAQGPGSFTGLRVGITAAKTLAYALGRPLTAVHSLAASAWAAGPASGRVWAVLDAQRQQLYAASFASPTDLATATPPTAVYDVEAWLAQLRPGDVATGPPLVQLAARLPAGVQAAPSDRLQADALAVAQLGWEAWLGGRLADPFALAPAYYRASAAEEKADAVAAARSVER
jgi:tRNA threonylcarbamoyladenosine biosynthesis protein TsaB